MPEMKRSARLALLRSLLEEGEFASQHELSAALVERDVEVSQSTLSKDLLVLGAVKRRTADGSLVYAVGDESEGGGVAAEKLAGAARNCCSQYSTQPTRSSSKRLPAPRSSWPLTSTGHAYQG